MSINELDKPKAEGTEEFIMNQTMVRIKNPDITLDFSLSLINVIGQFVIIDKQELFSGEYVKQVDVSNYANGVYFIELKTDSGVITKKLILQ